MRTARTEHLTDERIAAFGRWVVDTCALFGATPETGHEVAAICTRRLREDRDTDEKIEDQRNV